MASTESANRALNLQVLRRGDPQTEDIMCSATHVAAYDFDEGAGAWRRKDIEGTLFVVKRTGRPRFRLVVMNRMDPRKNLVEDLDDPEVEFEVSLPYLMYRNREGAVNGIWFYAEDECNSVAELLRKIVDSLGGGGGGGADFLADSSQRSSGGSRGESPVALTVDQIEGGTMAQQSGSGRGDGMSSMAEEVERERQQRQAKSKKEKKAKGTGGAGGTPGEDKGAASAADDANGAANIMEMLGIRGPDRAPPVSNTAHQQAQQQYQMQMAQIQQQQQQQQQAQQQQAQLSPMELMAQLNVGGSRGASPQPQPAVVQPVVKAAQPPPAKAAQKPAAKAEPRAAPAPAPAVEDDNSIMALFSHAQAAQAPAPQATPVSARRERVPSPAQQQPQHVHHAPSPPAPPPQQQVHHQPHAVPQAAAVATVAAAAVPPSYSEGSVRRALLALVNDDDFVSMIHKALEKAAGKS